MTFDENAWEIIMIAWLEFLIMRFDRWSHLFIADFKHYSGSKKS